MSREFIYFTGILALLMAATLAVPAQEVMAGLNNASMNNTTLNTSQNLTSLHATSNDTVMNTTISDPGLNNTSQESALISSTPAANVILPVNDTATIEPTGSTSNQVEVATSEGSEGMVFPIGSGLQSDRTFVVNGNARQKDTFTVGLPIKPVRDVSKMMFVCDIV